MIGAEATGDDRERSEAAEPRDYPLIGQPVTYRDQHGRLARGLVVAIDPPVCSPRAATEPFLVELVYVVQWQDRGHIRTAGWIPWQATEPARPGTAERTQAGDPVCWPDRR